MAIKLGVGKSSFEDLRESGSYYVDKTELIYDLVENNNEVTLFTRPRRFGKTLNMSMLESFFNIEKDSRGIFEGLNITAHEAFCDEWMNKYPVLFISFKDVEDLNFKGAYAMLETEIADVCKNIAGLLKDYNEIDPDDRAIFKNLKARTAGEEDVKKSLKTIMHMMYAVYGKPVILLIDEYDVPLALSLIHI